MISGHVGELAALLTAIFWTVTALSFEKASKSVGSLSVNIIRLVIAFLFISVYSWVSRGYFFPTDASTHAWLWLMLSGFVGFVLGDLFLFKSYMVMSARVSMLIMALAPPMTALFGWIFLGEILTWYHGAGMVLTLTGIAMVVLDQPGHEEGADPKKFKLSYPLSGLLLAFGGAVGQALGLILSKIGMQNYDAFASTQIRIIAGIIGFAAIFTVFGRWSRVFSAVKHKSAMSWLTLGAFFGPFLGVSFSLIAVQNTHAGVAATIMAIVPVLIIPPSVFFFGEKVTPKEILGAILSVTGVAILFL
ncbi:MAG: DMT family transporter [Bacteroidetes bacterium]|nr:DMT family transporter [Bacteroidota bacterium]